MKWLTNKSGNGFPLVVAIVLAILMFSCAIFEYMRLTIIASGVRDAVQSSIIAVVAENYSNVYSSLRQSYSGGYLRSGNEWQEQVSIGHIYPQLQENLGLTQQGTRYAKLIGDQAEYSVSGLNVTLINAPFAPLSPSTTEQFTAEALIQLEVPLSFGWGHLPPMKAELHVKAIYMPRFNP
ncbi:hypothetical protein [Paenibacillus donghaensis]|uniref:Uncharacterized protein n=1 Tax=Paenibacillus donghaensis TaxID=414771 RepID=A0A2Z2KC61_9BACL|nr:hypothetical protein [Paenibacillus donghaensis]ASA23414.1 hypothetical protein B9T62_22970 [Paenibacillus donghaensis]